MYRWRANLLLNTTMDIIKNCRLGHEMHKINFLPTKGNACDAVFDLKYKQFDFVLFSVEVKIHVKANLPI